MFRLLVLFMNYLVKLFYSLIFLYKFENQILILTQSETLKIFYKLLLLFLLSFGMNWRFICSGTFINLSMGCS